MTAIYPWQKEQWRKGMSAQQAGRLPHALLVHGSEGTGKLDFVHKFSQKLLCANETEKTACGICKSCNLFRAGSHPDFKLLSSEENAPIKIEEIRSLEDQLKLTAYGPNYKIAVICPAENLNINAANSLLKTLEEPAANTLIILVSHRPQKLLPTIRSRCQRIFIALPSTAEALDWLGDKDTHTDPGLLLDMACGSPLLALEYDKEEYLAAYKEFLTDFSALYQQTADPMQMSVKWHKENFSGLLKWLMWLTASIIKASMKSATVSDKMILKYTNDTTDRRWLFEFYDDLLRTQNMIHSSINQRLVLDNLMLKWHAKK